jgi:hypothetical protein
MNQNQALLVLLVLGIAGAMISRRYLSRDLQKIVAVATLGHGLWSLREDGR